MVKDAVGREIKSGQVIVHFSRYSSTMYSEMGVVKRVHPTEDSLIWQGIDRWTKEMRAETRLIRPDLCVVIPDMVEADLLKAE